MVLLYISISFGTIPVGCKGEGIFDRLLNLLLTHTDILIDKLAVIGIGICIPTNVTTVRLILILRRLESDSYYTDRDLLESRILRFRNPVQIGININDSIVHFKEITVSVMFLDYGLLGICVSSILFVRIITGIGIETIIVIGGVVKAVLFDSVKLFTIVSFVNNFLLNAIENSD